MSRLAALLDRITNLQTNRGSDLPGGLNGSGRRRPGRELGGKTLSWERDTITYMIAHLHDRG